MPQPTLPIDIASEPPSAEAVAAASRSAQRSLQRAEDLCAVVRGMPVGAMLTSAAICAVFDIDFLSAAGIGTTICAILAGGAGMRPALAMLLGAIGIGAALAGTALYNGLLGADEPVLVYDVATLFLWGALGSSGATALGIMLNRTVKRHLRELRNAAEALSPLM